VNISFETKVHFYNVSNVYSKSFADAYNAHKSCNKSSSPFNPLYFIIIDKFIEV